MTREEALNILHNSSVYHPDYLDALNMAIEALEQEPCDDAISRQAVLDMLEDINAETEGVGFYYKHYVEYIKALPPVTPAEKVGQWIPVSERLPESLRFVNCTCHSLIDDREDWVIETFYLPQPVGSPYSDWGNIVMLNDGDCEVIAWMYRDIPEPYKTSPTGEEVEE